MVKELIFSIFLLGFGPWAWCQLTDSNPTQDTTIIADKKNKGKSSKNKDGYFAMFEGKPGKAALLSAVVPGLGQIYNKKYWKAPIVWGVEGSAIAAIIFFNQEAKRFDSAFKRLLRNEISEYMGRTDPETFKRLRDSNRRSRDYSIAGLAVAHVINIADAFVNRHLIEFDIDDDLSFILPPSGLGIGIVYHIN